MSETIQEFTDVEYPYVEKTYWISKYFFLIILNKKERNGYESGELRLIWME